MSLNTVRYIHKGDALDYTPSSDVSAGSVIVVGSLVGIAANDIPANEQDAIQISGVWRLPKATGAVTVGASLYWDATNSKLTTTSTNNTYFGKATKAATSAASYVEAKILQ